MIYRVFGDYIVLRLEKGDEVFSCIKQICEKKLVRLGTVTGIGAINHLEMGLYDVSKKEYFKNTLDKDLEITSLMGNVSKKDGETYLHVHITAADREGKVWGGHLNQAIVSATGEIFIHSIYGNVERREDDETGLNLMEF